MSAYAGRAVAVIGGLGFIGRHLSNRLRRLGADVRVVARHLPRRRDDVAECEGAGIEVIEGDLRDAAAMRDAVVGREIVFNLAGQSGAVQSMDDPWTDLDVNCRGNLVLLEALRQHNPRARLVFVSSRLTYGRVGGDPVPETREPDPLCVHAVHKLAVEQYLKVYARLYGLPVVTARLTNPYGPGQPRDRVAYGVVNRLIHLALEGRSLPIYGDGSQRRDYIYIDDAVEALLALGTGSGATGAVYNIGSGIGTRMVDMARAIAAIAGAVDIAFQPWPAMAERIETGDFVADISRIRRDTGWSPAVTLHEGLERTVAFYRAHAA